MGLRKFFIVPVIGLSLGFWAAISQVHAAPDGISNEGLEAGAKLVITSICGPAKAIHGQTISVSYTVENQGTIAAGAYKVGLYLSRNKQVSPSADILIDKRTFYRGLKAGESRLATSKVLIPSKGLSGQYYYGATVSGNKKVSSNKVFLVRYSLTDDNQSVVDHKTGFIWQRSDDAAGRTWADAKTHCSNLVYGEHADWKLPRIDALETIVDYSRANPAIDPIFNCRSNVYWSSSTHSNNPDLGWVVHFSAGDVYANFKSGYYFVRCVRNAR